MAKIVVDAVVVAKTVTAHAAASSRRLLAAFLAHALRRISGDVFPHLRHGQGALVARLRCV